MTVFEGIGLVLPCGCSGFVDADLPARVTFTAHGAGCGELAAAVVGAAAAGYIVTVRGPVGVDHAFAIAKDMVPVNRRRSPYRWLVDFLEAQLDEHGSRARYRRGCRCELCTAQETSYIRAYRRAKREAESCR